MSEKTLVDKYPEFKERIRVKLKTPNGTYTDIDKHIWIKDIEEILDNHFIRKGENTYIMPIPPIETLIEKKKVKDAIEISIDSKQDMKKLLHLLGLE